jgi:predicted MPP superfamily phosphohydrolase
MHWLSDLHLDRLEEPQINHLLKQIADSRMECIAISGDISHAQGLTAHLHAIASACYPRPVFFVCGNHDYYGGSVASVDADIRAICAKTENLHLLDGQEIIPLNRHTCLIGDGGWPDVRAGYGMDTCVRSPDHRAIRDFHGMNRQQFMLRMQEMGKCSAAKIRNILPLALTRYPRVILLTHVPPFPRAVRYNDGPCGPRHLPYYANLSAGLAIQGIAGAFPHRRITILAGHAHSACVTHIGTTICVRVAHARAGSPATHQVLRL